MEYLKIIRIQFMKETRNTKRLFGLFIIDEEEVTTAYVTFSNNRFEKICVNDHPEWMNAREGDFVQLQQGDGYLLRADANEPHGVYFSLPADKQR